MIYFLIAFFPVTLASMCFLLRKQSTLVSIIALFAAVTESILVAWMPLESPARFLGVRLIVVSLNRLFLLTFCVTLVVVFLATFQLPHGENFPAMALLTLGLVAAILVSQDPFVITLLLLATSLAVILALVDLPADEQSLVTLPSIEAALRYLALMLLAGLILSLGFVLVDTMRLRVGSDLTSVKLSLALLLIGFGLRLAALPFHSWLPNLLEEATPLVSLLVVGVINVTALIFLVLSFQYIADLLASYPRGAASIRVFAVVTALGASLLLLRQRSLRRFIAFLIIYNTGVILCGMVSNPTGLTGALFDAFNQVLFALLLFLSLALLEQPEPRVAAPQDGLLRRRPIASAGFLGAVLGLLGLPPFSGFTSKALIYEGVASQGWGYLAALLVATAICGYSLALLVGEHFLGQVALPRAEEEGTRRDLLLPPRPQAPREPRFLAGMILILLLLGVLLGAHPQPLLSYIVETVQILTFV